MFCQKSISSFSWTTAVVHGEVRLSIKYLEWTQFKQNIHNTLNFKLVSIMRLETITHSQYISAHRIFHPIRFPISWNPHNVFDKWTWSTLPYHTCISYIHNTIERDEIEQKAMMWCDVYWAKTMCGDELQKCHQKQHKRFICV